MGNYEFVENSREADFQPVLTGRHMYTAYKSRRTNTFRGSIGDRRHDR